jgi:NAD(P)-dependent dehydrogenase (short-subunit alcohol dehydrogenase family)
MSWTVDLTGQVSLVTGGATGIGAAACRGYAQAGSHVVVNYYPSDRDRAEASKLIEELEGLGVQALGIECDVTDEAGVNEMVEQIIGKWGRIDNVFSNAGLTTPTGLMHETDYEAFQRIYRIALDGTFLVLRACLPHMLEQGAGDIVLMGSGTVLNGGGSSVAYPAGKAALEGLMAEMVNEYAPKGIRVNLMRPMVIDTAFMRGRYTPEGWNEYVSHLPMKRGGTAEDIANLVVFLSDRNRSGYIVGEAINIDGGRIYHVIFK